MINFQKELNDEQLQVVLNGDGPCLVLAGAGSGKTRTVTYRVGYLLEKGIRPENILLVTFTNKAANEMKERLAKLVCHSERSEDSVHLRKAEGSFAPTQDDNKNHQKSILPWSGTFHHIGYRILRQYAPLIGYGNNFTVLDSDDSESLLKLSIKEFKPDDLGGRKRFPSPAAIGAAISFSRNASISLAEVVEERFPEWLGYLSEFEKIASDYTKRKKEANAMDFDDLLVNFLLLLQSPQVARKFSDQFHYILVDEYQDTNTIQAAIIKNLAAVHKNVLVVGDDAQSIYSFRAADIENILSFEKDYPGAKIFKLETNYRSSQEILEVANSVIENNEAQYKKHLKTIAHGNLPALHPQIDQQSEGEFVAEKIAELIKSGTAPSEIAVLFRAAYHSQMLEVELVRRGIEYDYRGGVRFFERSHIKDILAYLRILNNPLDAAAWLRVLMHEEGIGPAAAEKLISAVRGIHKEKIENGSWKMEIAEAGRNVISGKALFGFENFLLIFKTVLESTTTLPSELIEVLLSSPYREYLETEFVDSKERMMDLKQLMLFAEGFDTLTEFLANTTLQESFQFPVPSGTGHSPGEQGAGEDGRRPVPHGTGKIILSTIHQAKGLEWEVVFIINLASGAFPSDRATREPNGIEEERRLFYVAVTRAKKYLYLTYPMAGGTYGDFLSGPSQFLGEIPPRLLEDHSLLSTDTTILDDDSADVHYVPEDDRPPRFKPGSFLREIEDL